MDINRVNDILKNKRIKDVFYDDQPVWLQEVNGNIAKVGFLNSRSYQDINIKDLYEK